MASSFVAVPLAALAVVGAAAALMTEGDREEMLHQHNVYRCMHQVPLMVWDEELASAAQEWADKSVWAHSKGADEDDYGENLAWRSPKNRATARAAVKSWYVEVTKTTTLPLVSRHYTAVIWKSTTRVGCGKGSVQRHGMDARFWVCRYSPTPDVAGEFWENVMAPSVSWSQCGGTAKDVPEGFPDFFALPASGTVPETPTTQSPLAVAPAPTDPSIPMAIAPPPEEAAAAAAAQEQQKPADEEREEKEAEAAAAAEEEHYMQENVITMMGQVARGNSDVALPVVPVTSNPGRGASVIAATAGALLITASIVVASQQLGSDRSAGETRAEGAERAVLEQSDCEE